MTWLEILERIESGEGDQVEFKRGVGDGKKICETMCAFANSEGGVVILGVEDKTREIVGVKENAENVQRDLTNFLQTGCSAPVSARLGCHESSNGWVHWIDVSPQRGFEPMRTGGKVFVRRGRSNVEPSASERQELNSAFGFIRTEDQVIQASAPESIDMDSFRSYLRALDFSMDDEPQPSEEDDLRNRGVIAELGGELRATLYGILAFGKDPQRYLQTRNFWIECAAYEGEDRASQPLIITKAKGRLDEQVKRALGWFQGLGRTEDYRGLFREDRLLLPLNAVREALVNSVVHRDYAVTGSKTSFEVFSHQVHVTSPGALPNSMTAASVQAGGLTRTRNESMAIYMEGRGMMERRSRGWPIMRRAMREFNGTQPELEVNESFVRVIFHLDS